LNTVGHDALIVETYVWPTEAATQAWATALAAKPQLRNAIIELHGDLGAGKTTLVRHLLRALGVSGRIKSPSYAVVEPHVAPAALGGVHTYPPADGQDELQIWHFDFYRFNDPREWEDAGFRDIFTAPGLKLMEWADKARAALPVPDLALYLTVLDDDSRQVAMAAHTTTGRALIA
jgi:tRNA threonylcarbamoyladenosine biosynthesis protein TsaE